MIYQTPKLTGLDEDVLGQIEFLRYDLLPYLTKPRRWYGRIRQTAFARAVQGSNEIEGYSASIEDTAAIIADEPPLSANEETRLAIAGYRDALTFVLQLASEPVQVDISLLKSLHFMMLKHDLSKNPGQWRRGAVWVSNSENETVYEAPDRELLEPLLNELIEHISDSAEPSMVKAAMGHLNLTLIHPFSDGNGRMARCLQTFLLASEGEPSPLFSSIEEYLGRNTAAYYEVLEEVAAGAWSPKRSARSWIEFCLTAHYRQALTLKRRILEAEALWDACSQIASELRLPERTIGALCDAARGRRLWRSFYVKIVKPSTGDDLSEYQASRDLAAMASAGLLTAQGDKRARHYVASPALQHTWTEIREIIRKTRAPKSAVYPYVLARERQRAV